MYGYHITKPLYEDEFMLQLIIPENEKADYALRYQKNKLSKEPQRICSSPLINGTFIGCDLCL